MPLLITPAQPLTTTAQLSVATVYGIITSVSYRTKEKVIKYEVGYYASEAAYLADAAPVQSHELQTYFAQPATPEEANAVPIFQFLENTLATELRTLLGAETLIEPVA